MARKTLVLAAWRLWTVSLALLLTGGFGAMPRAAHADEAQCGGSKNPCPLEKWIAKAGSDAAKAGDSAKVKASCKPCHDQYKATYRGQYRARAFP